MPSTRRINVPLCITSVVDPCFLLNCIYRLILLLGKFVLCVNVITTVLVSVFVELCFSFHIYELFRVEFMTFDPHAQTFCSARNFITLQDKTFLKLHFTELESY
jgi:hypothetical protein